MRIQMYFGSPGSMSEISLHIVGPSGLGIHVLTGRLDM